MKKRVVVGARAKRVSLRLRVSNSGTGAATGVRVCITAPTRLLKVVGTRCRTVRQVGADGTVSRAFVLKTKPALRRKKTVRVTFTVQAPGARTSRAVVVLQVRR